MFLAQTSLTSTDYLLALATLGDATKSSNNPISSVVLPNVANFANVKIALMCYFFLNEKKVLAYKRNVFPSNSTFTNDVMMLPRDDAVQCSAVQCSALKKSKFDNATESKNAT